MNQNVVKTETAKTTTFLEREALAQLHKVLYEFDEPFYKEHVQNPGSMLGLFCNGGTMANVSAMWVARNHQLGPRLDDDGNKIFDGVEFTGIPKALRYYGYDGAIVIGSDLMHYSMNKAADVLGCGLQALVKIPVDTHYRVDLDMMEERILEAKRKRECVVAIVGICGTTETGAIDPLQDMANLAAKYNIHFHVDAAWGGPCMFFFVDIYLFTQFVFHFFNLQLISFVQKKSTQKKVSSLLPTDLNAGVSSKLIL